VRAIVIGAGFAGLAAADALQRAGAEVVVLEARDRVGGRVWSRTLANGSVVEMGAEFILPGNTVLTGLAERFGLGLWTKGMRYGDREPRGGIGVDRQALFVAADAVREALERVPAASSLSAGQLLDGLDIDPGAREALLARVEVSCANLADTVGADALRDVAAHATDVCPSVAGGNQGLALALAAELGSAVIVGSPVARVVWSEGRVVATAGSAEVAGNAAVVAVPASVLGAIAFEPALPAATAEAFASVVYGQAAKLFVPLHTVPQPSAVLSVPERYWTWTATAAGDEVQPVVHAYVGSAPALEAMRIAEGPGAWLASIARLRPDLDLDPRGAVLSTWQDDPWVRAAFSTHGPTAGNDLLTRRVGPLVFCGEHTESEYRGLMEGALRSGFRAAEQLLTGMC
jgi:monoamine oxidase